MYEAYWGVAEKPFHNTPDPRFLYRTAACDEALSRLLYVVQEGLGAAALTGVFGCGKTVIIQALADQLGAAYHVVVITNPAMTGTELLQHIAHQIGITDAQPANKAELLRALHDRVLNDQRDRRRTVLIIDEAHLITDATAFEELRLLLNWQERDTFLVTLILVGQPELRATLDANKAFAQRIALRFHLEQLSAQETGAYIAHRLAVAGRAAPVFTPQAIQAVHAATGGIPRRINHVCGFSLLLGFQRRAAEIDAVIVDEAAKELVG